MTRGVLSVALLLLSSVAAPAARAAGTISAQVKPPKAIIADTPQEIDVQVTNTGPAIPSAYAEVNFSYGGAAVNGKAEEFDPATKAWRPLTLTPTGQFGMYGVGSYWLPLPKGTTTDRLRFTAGDSVMGGTLSIGVAYSTTPISTPPAPTVGIPIGLPRATADLKSFSLAIGGAPQPVSVTYDNSTPVALPAVAPTVAVNCYTQDPPGAQQPTSVAVPAADLKVEWLSGTGWKPVPVKADATLPGSGYTGKIPTTFALAPGAKKALIVRVGLAAGTPATVVKGTLTLGAPGFGWDTPAFTVTGTATGTTPSATTATAASEAPSVSAPSDTSPSSSVPDVSTAPGKGSGGSGNAAVYAAGGLAALALAGALVWWRRFRR